MFTVQTVTCTKEGHNAATFVRKDESIESDGTQWIISQYYEAPCGCKFEVSIGVPNNEKREN